MLNFGISDLHLGIFVNSLGEPSLKPWAALGGEAGSDIDKLLSKCLQPKDSDFVVLF